MKIVPIFEKSLAVGETPAAPKKPILTLINRRSLRAPVCYTVHPWRSYGLAIYDFSLP